MQELLNCLTTTNGVSTSSFFPEVFVERYKNYKLDLIDKTHIDKIAQQVLQIANRDIKNAFGENGGCVRDTRTEFTTEIDHVDIADIVYPGYTLWYDECGDIGARCEVLIVVDVFTEVNAHRYCYLE